MKRFNWEKVFEVALGLALIYMLAGCGKETQVTEAPMCAIPERQSQGGYANVSLSWIARDGRECCDTITIAHADYATILGKGACEITHHKGSWLIDCKAITGPRQQNYIDRTEDQNGTCDWFPLEEVKL